MSATAPAVHAQRQRATLVRAVAVLVPLLLVSLLTLTNSRAAFTGTTDTTGTWGTATVDLDSSVAVPFEASNMVPGDVVQGRVEVTYDGSAASVDVRLFADELSQTDDVAEHLNLRVSTSDAHDGDIYGGSSNETLDDFAGTHTNFGNGADEWNGVEPNDTRDYYFQVELDSDAPNSVQDASASVDFVWEAQSNPTP